MQLRTIHLQNFRAYPAAELEIAPSGLIVITGPNNVGKSALLSALDMVGGQPIDGPLQFTGSTEPCGIQVDFEFTAGEKQQLASHVPEHVADVEADLVGARYTFVDVNDGQPRLGVTTIEIIHGGGDPWLVAQMVPRGGQSAEVRQVSWGQWLTSWPDKPDLPTGGMSGGGLTRAFEVGYGPDTLLAWFLAWRAGFYHFKALRQGQDRRKRSTEAERSLNPTGNNLANHLQWLRGHKEKAWNRIRATMSALIVDIGELQVRAEGSESEVGFDTDGRGFENIKDIGTGVEQLLMAITVGQTAAGSMLIIEEPETNLHPGSQRELMAHLSEWSKIRPILVATHSPTIIDAAGNAELYEVQRAAGKSSVIRLSSGDRDVSSVLVSLGVRYSDLLGSDRILVVEGPTDQAIMGAWFPRLATRGSVAVMPGGGGAGVWHIELADKVAAIAGKLPRPLIYVRDRDELSERDLTRLAKQPAVCVLKRRELENYLLDADAIATVLSDRLGDKRQLDVGTITDSIRKIADTLKNRVVRGRVLENATCLRRITPIATVERRKLYAASDLVAELVRIVKPKLEHPLGGLTQCLQEELKRQQQLVDRAWDKEWIERAPGADILSELFRQHGLGFSKESDGQAIARAMKEAPFEIRQRLDGFL